jgi:fructokinase
MTMPTIGLDIGGTKIAVARFDGDGQSSFEKRIATPKTYDDIVAATAALAREAGAGTIGIGSPGSPGPDGLWRNANMIAVNGRPFQSDLQSAIGRPIRMENDANCFALAEARLGAGKGKSVVAFFTIGTGLGGGLVIDGKLLRGAHGEAAEFGHMGMPWMTEREWPPLACFCGKPGCVEMYVSGTGLRQDWQRMHGETLEGPDVVGLARKGDARALSAIARLQDRFARVIGNLVNCFDPDIFVIGGGLAELPELVEEMPAVAAQYSFSGKARPRITRAAFANSGVRGAALLWD